MPVLSNLKIGSVGDAGFTLKATELPAGRLIVGCSKHTTAVIDGVIHDTYDSSRGGNRCVYGYFTTELGPEIWRKSRTLDVASS